LFQTPWSGGTPGDMPTCLSLGGREGPFDAPPKRPPRYIMQLASVWVCSCPLREVLMPGRAAIIWLISVFLCVPSGAQEGYYGVGHDRWHKEFYSKLNRNDGKGTCCDIMDCRPTQSRMVGDHYEVKVDGEWTPVPNDKINHVVAPDGGAHVCAPRQVGPNKGVIFCVVLPPEG
jgi:hypothetical protein